MAACNDTTTICTKGGQARVYCRRMTCLNRADAFAAWIAAVDLPQPNVDVTIADTLSPDGQTVSGKQVDVVLSRDGKARSYSSVGSGAAEAVKGVVEKILDDHHTAEYVKRG